MPTGVTITIRSNRIDELTRLLVPRTHTAVLETAGDIQDRASFMAPRDTGALSESIYVASADGSDYSQRAGSAGARNPDAVIAPEVNPEFVISFSSSSPTFRAVVGSAVNYGIFQELGTRFMPPQSFMLPATEVAADAFSERMSHIADL
jgi:HK97 gp10 family phage protein